MTKRRIKIHYMPIVIAIFIFLPVLTYVLYKTDHLKMNDSLEVEEVEEVDYVTNDVIEDTLPVINTTRMIIKPFVAPDVNVIKSYYDNNATEDNQLNSIIVHDNIYLQNTGIDYGSNNTFEVVSILEGTVENVEDNESLGKKVEIKHQNGLISVYQSLSEIMVKKGDIVNQGQVIGKSGTNELDKELGNHLHFEIYENGTSQNPLNYLEKEISNKEE